MHGAGGGTVDGNNGRVAAAIGIFAMGTGARVVGVEPGDGHDVGLRGGGTDLALEVDAARDNIEIAQPFGIDSTGADQHAATAVINPKLRPVVAQHHTTGTHRQAAGVIGRYPVQRHAVGVGDKNVGSAAKHFQRTFNGTASITRDLGEDGACFAGEVGIVYDVSADLAVAVAHAVVEDQSRVGNVEFAKAVVGKPLAVGVVDVHYRYVGGRAAHLRGLARRDDDLRLGVRHHTQEGQWQGFQQPTNWRQGRRGCPARLPGFACGVRCFSHWNQESQYFAEYEAVTVLVHILHLWWVLLIGSEVQVSAQVEH